jgi:hypothetical protein
VFPATPTFDSYLKVPLTTSRCDLELSADILSPLLQMDSRKRPFSAIEPKGVKAAVKRAKRDDSPVITDSSSSASASSASSTDSSSAELPLLRAQLLLARETIAEQDKKIAEQAAMEVKMKAHVSVLQAEIKELKRARDASAALQVRS